MSTIYRIKKVPTQIQQWAKRFMPDNVDLKPYWYYGRNQAKIYGCIVMKDGQLFHNATQDTLEGFELSSNIPF